MGKLLYDLFNLKIAGSQVVGGETFDVTEEFDLVAANNDGFSGEASVDKTFYGSEANLGCQDLVSLQTILAAIEAADTVTLLAEGKVAGDIAASQRCTFNRAKLISAALDFMLGSYAQTRFNFRNSAASGSTKAANEVAWTDVATKAITHSSALRATKLNGFTFTPGDGSPATIVPTKVYGLNFNVQFQSDQAMGDTDFGKTVETGGFVLGGTLSFRDSVLSSGDTVSQLLLGENYGSGAFPFARQNGGSAQTLTLANMNFFRAAQSLAARKFGGQTLGFRCFTMLGATAYTLATGSNKIVTVA